MLIDNPFLEEQFCIITHYDNYTRLRTQFLIPGNSM